MSQKWKGGKKEAVKRYKEKNKELVRERNRNWYYKNHEREKAKRRKYNAANKNRIYKQNTEWQRNARHKYKALAVSAYGGVCTCCSETRIAFLEIHHPNGDGKADRERFRGNSLTFYQWLSKNKYPLGYEILCANCHKALHGEGICPHKLEKSL